MRVLLALLLVLVPSLAIGLTPTERTQLAKGEVLTDELEVPGSDTPMLRARGVIDAPPEVVWSHIGDCNKYTDWLPRVASSKELKRVGENVWCRVEIDMPWPLSDLWAETKAHHEELAGFRYQRSWTLVKGTYKLNTGSWLIEPWGSTSKRSLVTYRVHVNPDISIPTSIQQHFQENSLDDIFEAVRARVKRT